MTANGSGHPARFAWYVFAAAVGGAVTMLSYTYRLEMDHRQPFVRIINRIREEREERRKDRDELAKQKRDRKAERDQWESEKRRLLDLLRRRDRSTMPAPEEGRALTNEQPVALKRSTVDHDSWECRYP